MAAPPLPVKGKRNRQLMVYAGAAGALLLLFLLARRGQAAATAQPADQAPQLTPVSSAAPAGDLGTGGAVDNGAQLAGFESALLDQLPQAVSSGVAAGLANGLPPAASLTDGGQTPAGAGSFADYAASATALVTLGSTLAGAQNGPGAGKPQPKKATTKKKPAPKPKAHPKPKPKPKSRPPAPKPPHVNRHPNDKHKR
jgi:hypothetical protein